MITPDTKVNVTLSVVFQIIGGMVAAVCTIAGIVWIVSGLVSEIRNDIKSLSKDVVIVNTEVGKVKKDVVQIREDVTALKAFRGIRVPAPANEPSEGTQVGVK